MQLYRAQFDTEEGPIELECWTMSPTDAAVAFMNFFRDGHPYQVPLADATKLENEGTTGTVSYEQLVWWRSKPVPTGDQAMLYISPGTRVNIEGTVIDYAGSSYRIWSCASVVG